MASAYVGRELPLFWEAHNFHDYYVQLFGSWVTGHVLEVGGGVGALTTRLLNTRAERVTVCEPDPDLASTLWDRFGERIALVRSDIHGVPHSIGSFDTILYVDVLEHIQDDAGEIVAAMARLKAGGALIIAGPAHAGLYSAFDAAIGHYRRYDRRTLEALIRAGGRLEMVRFAYFDCLGMILSLGNRWVNRQSLPSRRQLLLWDRVILPMSRRLDPLLRYAVGKSFVAIARRTDQRAEAGGTPP
jgi:SAM-dependent methyltransferase